MTTTKNATVTSLIEHLQRRVCAKRQQLLHQLSAAQLDGRTERNADDYRVERELEHLKTRLAHHRVELFERGASTRPIRIGPKEQECR